MSDDDTMRIPLIVTEVRLPRWVLPAIALAYALAGGVLSFGCLVLIHAADQINSSPMCRRL